MDLKQNRKKYILKENKYDFVEISSSKLAKIQKRTEGIQKFPPRVLVLKPNSKWVLVIRLFYLDMH